MGGSQGEVWVLYQERGMDGGQTLLVCLDCVGDDQVWKLAG